MPPPILQSPLLLLLGVPHGFSTRHGGVSSGAYASLNFGSPGNLPAEQRDPAVNIRRNWGVLIGAMAGTRPGAAGDLSARGLVEVHQMHGNGVCVVRNGSPAPIDVDGHDVKADAIVTDDPRRLAAIRVADCTPVLIASGDGRIVAAVHAGWRGVVGAIVAPTIFAMRELGARPAAMAAAVGPCIGPDSFEVGPEVADEFHRVFGTRTPHVRAAGSTGKALVDLKGALKEQLIAAGLAPERVDVLPHCTMREHADFFSHRRERGVTGRMVGVIGPRAG